MTVVKDGEFNSWESTQHPGKNHLRNLLLQIQANVSLHSKHYSQVNCLFSMLSICRLKEYMRRLDILVDFSAIFTKEINCVIMCLLYCKRNLSEEWSAEESECFPVNKIFSFAISYGHWRQSSASDVCLVIHFQSDHIADIPQIGRKKYAYDKDISFYYIFICE